MLDKLRLFNKEKPDRNKTQISKRTSSSSGFSSARSERSDSSLSLNEAQAATAIPTKSKSNEKQEKNSKADTASSAKSSKASKLLSSSKQKEKKADKKSEKSPKKMEGAMEHYSESNITIVDSKGPPKKKIESKLKPAVQIVKNLETKSESRTSLSSLTGSQKSGIGIPVMQNTFIPKPMAAIKGTSKPPPEKPPDEVKPTNEKNFEKPTFNGNGLNPLHAQLMNESTHSNSTHNGHHSNSSDNSSVIFCPGSDAGSDVLHSNGMNNQPKNPIPNRKIDTFANDLLVSNDAQLLAQQQQQQSQQNGNKFHTVPTKVIGATIYEEEKQQITVVPMRPLLRGYNSHVTLPTRGARGQHMVADYCDDMGQQGYCSDGDALRTMPTRYSDNVEKGYMSEGGTPTKHYLSILRNRSQLPTTIEER